MAAEKQAALPNGSRHGRRPEDVSQNRPSPKNGGDAEEISGICGERVGPVVRTPGLFSYALQSLPPFWVRTIGDLQRIVRVGKTVEATSFVRLEDAPPGKFGQQVVSRMKGRRDENADLFALPTQTDCFLEYCVETTNVVKTAMATFFEKVESAYVERALRTYNAVVRPSDIARLLEKFPELVQAELELINAYFLEHGTLEGLAVKFRDD